MGRKNVLVPRNLGLKLLPSHLNYLFSDDSLTFNALTCEIHDVYEIFRRLFLGDKDSGCNTKYMVSLGHSKNYPFQSEPIDAEKKEASPWF
jgi:hypothetical protein